MNNLAAVAVAAAQPPSMWVTFAPMVIIIAIFYFVAILPMRRRQQQLQRTIEALKKGDRVLTNGGIYGEVAGVDPKSVVLKVADNVKIRVAKSAIAGMQTEDGASS